MSETVLSIEDVARCFTELVERVHSSGETTLLMRSGHTVARIVPVTACQQGTGNLIAFLHQWRLEHPEPDEHFGAATEESRRAVQPPRDPWE
jgi:antitoxin (DNA-binding transcriptional repressor) of toxin-antitoxin stability system